jgi:hypothetical protein
VRVGRVVKARAGKEVIGVQKKRAHAGPPQVAASAGAQEPGLVQERGIPRERDRPWSRVKSGSKTKTEWLTES